MRPADVAAAVLEAIPDALGVASLGTAVSALRLASGDGVHLYLGGSMGSALPVALGLADALPQRSIVALVGDGELLMGASALWSVAAFRPPNVSIVVLADGRYSITGGQPLSGEARFGDVAAALGGVASACPSDTKGIVTALLQLPGPRLVEALVDEPEWPGPSPFVDPGRVRVRLEQLLLEPDADRQPSLTAGDP